MECNVCKEELYNLFDSDSEQGLVNDIKAHLMECSHCAGEYQKMQEAIAQLQPKVQPIIPVSIKQNIIHQLNGNEKKNKPFRINSTVKRILSVAAILAIIMLIIPFVDKNDGFMNSTAQAANNLLETSIEATGLVRSMIVKLKVRTVARDNFSFVGAECDMVEHNICKSFEKPEKWRVDKGGRIVVFDGKNQYLWISDLEEGIKAGKNANFIEWFKILLNPESILLKEKASTNNKDSKFILNESNGELHLTITSKAQGNFINDYCKNKSIEESDNRREYTFDSTTKLLKGLKIFILNGDKETLILETENIEYNVAVNQALFSIALPKGLEWKELADDIKNETFSNISSKRAAELIFDAMAKSNWDSIKNVWQLSSRVFMVSLKMEYGGLEVIKIGEPFKSGLYRGEYVPYIIKKRNGSIKKHNLALRNDNKNKVWIVDGGL